MRQCKILPSTWIASKVVIDERRQSKYIVCLYKKVIMNPLKKLQGRGKSVDWKRGDKKE
jgi:hypothetical protein